MSNDEAKAFFHFQLFNNARDFLEKITSGEQDACKQQQETTTYDSTESYYQEWELVKHQTNDLSYIA